MNMLQSLIVALTCIVALSPSQDSTTFLDNLKPISVDNVTQIKEVGQIIGTQAIQMVTWSPNGKLLAVIRGDKTDKSVEIWEFETETLPDRPIMAFIPSIVDKIQWLPDNQTIVTYGMQYSDTSVHFEVLEWNYDTGKSIKTLLDANVERPDFNPPVPPVLGWSRDYSEFVVPKADRTIQLSNGDTFIDDGSEGVIYHVEWSSDGHYLAVLTSTSDAYGIHILDLQTSKSVLFAFGPDYYVREMVWSPDSSVLAVASVSPGEDSPLGSVRFYRLGEDVHYGNEALITGELGNGLSYDLSKPETFAPPPGIAWSPDNKVLAIGFPNSFELYETTTFTSIKTIIQNDILSVDWHPSNKVIISGGTDGIIYLWGIPFS
jgi:WD40 repeat protein